MPERIIDERAALEFVAADAIGPVGLILARLELARNLIEMLAVLLAAVEHELHEGQHREAAAFLEELPELVAMGKVDRRSRDG